MSALADSRRVPPAGDRRSVKGVALAAPGETSIFSQAPVAPRGAVANSRREAISSFPNTFQQVTGRTPRPLAEFLPEHRAEFV
jgi:hypothetical protein